MTQIFIEDKELDINAGISNQITYAVDDLYNLDSKATSFSKTIILPGTNNNNLLFGSIFEFGNANFTNDNTPNVYYNFNASKSAKARIDVDGLTIIKGVLRLLQIVVDGDFVEYEVAIFGELGGFVANMAGKKLIGNDNTLYDLDFSQYNHQYTITNILDSWDNSMTLLEGNYEYIFTCAGATCIFNINAINLNLVAGMQITFSGTVSNNSTFTIASVTEYLNYNNTGISITSVTLTTTPNGEYQSNHYIKISTIESGRGYVYPLIDYGGASTNKIDYDYRTFRPALYVKEYVDKIIEKAGYTYQSNFFNTNFFKRLIVPNNDLGFLKYSTQTYGSADAIPNQLNILGSQFKNVRWASSTLTNFNVISVVNTNDTLQANQNTNVKLTLHYIGFVYYFPFASGGLSKISIFKNTSIIDEFIIDTSSNIPNGTGAFTGYVVVNFDVIKEVTESFLINDTLSVKTYAYFSLGGIALSSTNIKIDKYPPGYIDYVLGDNIKINDAIPRNILQKDFFASIIKMFNLMVTEDKYKDKHLIIEPYVDFYDNNVSSYIDWSDKVDRSKPIVIKPMSEVNARYYEFKYKPDSDYYNDYYKKKYNEGYGDRVYDNALEFAKDTQKTEVIFSATPLVGYTGVDKVVSTIFKKNNSLEEKVNSNIRILQFKKITGVASWKIFNIQTNANYQTGLTSYGYAGHLDDPDIPNADLNFGATKELFFTLASGALGNNMFNAYYSSYMAEITDKDSRVITATLYLNDIDIFNLDFSKYIFIDGILYRLQKITDYTSGELCKVELLRVINTIY